MGHGDVLQELHTLSHGDVLQELHTLTLVHSVFLDLIQ